MAFSPPSDAVEVGTTSPQGGGFRPPVDSVEAQSTRSSVQQSVQPNPQTPQEDAPKEGSFAQTLAKVAVSIPGFGGLVAGTEGVVSAASQLLGFGGYVAGGAAGLAGEAMGMPKGYAADLAERSAKNLQVSPLTEQGKEASDVLTYPFKKIGELGEAAGHGTVGAMTSAYDEQIKHAKQYGAPKWFTGTKEEYISKLEKDAKTTEEAAPLAGAIVENTVGMLTPTLGMHAAGSALGKASKALPDRVKEMGEYKAPERPPETATTEEKQVYKDKIQEIITARKANSPLAEAAIRNKETGEIERMGPKHDEARKEATKDTHEQGFMTERGDFLNRKDALEQAKRTKQIPEDHALDFPDEGLHSGDLRRAGEDKFKITEDQPQGEPAKDGSPTTREEYKSAIEKLRDQQFDHEFAGDHAKSDAVGKQIEDLKGKMPAVEFKDPMKPTWEELHDHIYDARSAGEAFDKIQEAGIGTPQQKILVKALSKLSGVRDARLELLKEHIPFKELSGEQKDAAGLYHPEPNVIQIGKGGNISVLLHESIHAGTYRFIKEGNTIAAQRLNALFDKYKASHNQGQYGFRDVYEFAAEAFTSKNFQNLLASIKHGDQPQGKIASMWDEFKSAVKQGLNIPDNARTALEEVLDAGSQIMEKQEAKYKEEGKMYGGDRALPSTGSDVLDQFKAKKKPKDPDGAMHNLHDWFLYTLNKDEKAARKALSDMRGLLEYLPPQWKKTVDDAQKRFESRYPVSKDVLPSTGSDEVDKVVAGVDVRTIPDKESFHELATNIFETHGEEAALDFLDAYKQEIKDRSIPVPTDNKSLDRSGHILDGFTTADASEAIVGYRDATKEGITKEQREEAYRLQDDGKEVPGRLGEILKTLDEEKTALVKKAKAMGLKIGEEFEKGQNRIRLFGTAEQTRKTWKEFFANKTPLGEKVAEQANNAMERKVFGIEGTNRVVEIHRQSKDATITFRDEKGRTQTRDVKKGTSLWEWKDGKKEQIAHTDNLEAGKTEIYTTKKGEKIKLSDGKVSDIEKHSPYRYLHDAEASARLALMGLRKYVREAEYFNNLVKSDLFQTVGHGPDKPLETLPKGWKVPNNIDRIPQLRGWHFDPKTAAIIEDFAKVWDNNLWMKMTNQIIKAIMLNPLPHMMNEFMHLWNARGLSGWIAPSGLKSLTDTGIQAWKDVANQTQYYRDLMKQGGSILGATPRNNFFDKLQEGASKEIFGNDRINKSVSRLAVKLGTTAAEIYNGVSKKSQQAMWFTRDVMYVQYVREIQALHEKRTGEKMSIEDATEKAGRHMPTYHTPSEILGSRTIAKVMKNPNITTFSSYHYGVMNSLINTIKDVDPRLLKTKQGRTQFKDGVDSLLAIGVASAVLYPLMDKFAAMIFGEGAEQRKAGPYHVIEGVTKVMSGEKDLTALLWPVFTFNPMVSLMGQLAINKKMFSGKEIYHPNDNLGENLQDAGTFVLKQLPQGPGLMSAVNDEGGAGAFLAKQMDIKAQTPEQRTIIERAKKRQEIAHKAREKARQHGKYKP